MKRNLGLDGIRGYAAIAVCVYHAILYFNAEVIEQVLLKPIQNVEGWYNILAKIVLMIFNGETAVILFFVMSGTVLFESMKKNEHLGVLLNSSIFFVKRLIRIYPTVIICLLFFFIVMKILHYFYPNIFVEFIMRQFYENASLYKITMNGATWTLQYEILAIPFIIIGFYVFRFFGTFGLILFLGYSLIILDNPNMFFQLPIIAGLGSCLYYFVLGFIIPTRLGSSVFESINKKSWVLVFPIMLVIRHISPHSMLSNTILQMMLCGMFVGIVYYGKETRINQFLSNRVSVYLGKISFSFYLLNVVFLNVFCKLFSLSPHAVNHYLEFGIISSLLTIAVSIPLSHLSERYLERGSIKIGRKIESMLTRRSKNILIDKNITVNQ